MLAMTRRVIVSRGWRYEIASDPAPVRYLNIRFLSGYRRPWQFDPEVIAAVTTAARTDTGLTIRNIVARTPQAKPVALATVMHLLVAAIVQGGPDQAAFSGNRCRGDVVSDVVPVRNRGIAAVPVGVGTRFVYDGEIFTVVELFPTARGNEVLVADRGAGADAYPGP